VDKRNIEETPRPLDPLSISPRSSSIGNAALRGIIERYSAEKSPRAFFKPIVELTPNVLAAPTLAEIAVASRKVLVSKLVRTLMPIVDSLRGESSYAQRINAALRGGPIGVSGKPSRFRFNQALLEQQRPLTEWEREQSLTMEQLSVANAYIMAAREAPEITAVCMEDHFSRLGDATREKLPSGSFVPVAVLGIGSHGTVIASEILRRRPDLVGDTVYIDRGHLPAGPWTYPNGKAWSINSAAPQGEEPFALPDFNTEPGSENSIRAKNGGFLRGIPGERNTRSNPNGPRPYSINRIVEFLVAPDTKSPKRYVDNYEMSIELQKQAALLVDNLLNDTDLVGVSANTDGCPGALKLTLEDIAADGSRTTRIIYTDEFYVAAGKQKPNVGFEDTAEFQTILDAQEAKPGLPYYLNGLDTYKILTDRKTPEQLEHGATFILEGDGNTIETALELLAGLFTEGAKEGNFDPAKIEKIYVLGGNATAKIANRRRYKQLLDLLARNGRENVLELIDDRGKFLESSQLADGTLELSVKNEAGEPIRNKVGEIIRGNHVIEGTGFSSDLDDAFRPLLDNAGVTTLEEAFEDVMLPGSKDIPIGRRFRGLPNIAFFGTICGPNFSSSAKRDQLPELSRRVLELISENVVALGFTTPDTQALIALQLSEQAANLPTIDLNRISASFKGESLEVDKDAGPGTYVGPSLDSAGQKANRNRFVDADSSLLTPLLITPMATDRLSTSGDYEFRVEIIGFDRGEITLKADQNVPESILKALANSAAGPQFALYARQAITQRRGAKSLEAVLTYKGKTLRPQESYVQAI
jgi:hypothetical protein